MPADARDVTDFTPTQILELIRLTIHQGELAVFSLEGSRVIFRSESSGAEARDTLPPS